MTYRLAADALVLFHLAFILFVVFGGLLVIRWPVLKWLHLPAALWGALVELGGWDCPLTRYENLLRGRAGGGGGGGVRGGVHRPLHRPGDVSGRADPRHRIRPCRICRHD
jgi:hypothetical protein